MHCVAEHALFGAFCCARELELGGVDIALGDGQRVTVRRGE